MLFVKGLKNSQVCFILWQYKVETLAKNSMNLIKALGDPLSAY